MSKFRKKQNLRLRYCGLNKYLNLPNCEEYFYTDQRRPAGCTVCMNYCKENHIKVCDVKTGVFINKNRCNNDKKN